MAAPPKNIRALRGQGVLEIAWPDGALQRLPFKFLRGQCPCAACVDEITGQRILDVDSVPDDVAPANMSFSGNYALKVIWSDEHQSGLYTWSYLRELGSPGE